MKINRLSTLNRNLTREAAERARAAAAAAIRRVEAEEGVEADRQRSLQEELGEVQAKAVGPFEGNERALQNARALAEKLARLGPDASAMVHPRKRMKWQPIDTEA